MTMIIADRFERVGRPKNCERFIEMKPMPVPKKGDFIKVEETRRIGNNKKRMWIGKVISETSCMIVMKLESGVNEGMLKNDFISNQLSYIQIVH